MAFVCHRHFFPLLVVVAVLVCAAGAWAADMVRVTLEPGAVAAIMDGRVIALEVSPSTSKDSEAFLRKFLADPAATKAYKNLKTAGIPFSRLNGPAQRRTLEALFPDDFVDESGWWHTVTYRGAKGVETLFGIAEWLTGRGTNYKEILALDQNASIEERLRLGDQILIPRAILSESMKAVTPGHATPRMPRPATVDLDELSEEGALLEEIIPVVHTEDLTYGEDSRGKYAEYRIKRGETLYSDVVVRFSDLSEHADIQDACEEIMKRSGIKDAASIKAGQRIRVPLDMLSDAYQPEGSAQRASYVAMRNEAKKLKTTEAAKGLKGVLVVLDPGHGGRDKGAMNTKLGLYEDELTYDIVARLKKLLETKSQAKVYVTMKDPDQGYEPTTAKRFLPDEDEMVLVTPPYKTEDARIAATLRWYLANDIYRKALKAGQKESKSLFLSVHCDSLFNGKVRGSMVYVPGAAYRQAEETPAGEIYDRFAEARAQRTVKTTSQQRNRDEAFSLNFAGAVVNALNASKKPAIKVHGPGEPIRNVIRQKGGRAYVPAVLRNCMIPTKVLVETANLTNATDCANLADPAWRQGFAEALYKAITNHFGG